jgi:hypothetical protein
VAASSPGVLPVAGDSPGFRFCARVGGLIVGLFQKDTPRKQGLAGRLLGPVWH